MVATTLAPSALVQALLAAAQGVSAQAQVLLALAQILLAQDQPTPLAQELAPPRRRRRRRRRDGRSASSVEPASSSQEEAVPSVESLSGIATPCWSEADDCAIRGLLGSALPVQRACGGFAAPPGLQSWPAHDGSAISTSPEVDFDAVKAGDLSLD